MSLKQNDPYVLIDPKTPLPCALAVLIRQSCIGDVREIEKSGKEHTFRVRAVLSDHIPLAGSIDEVVSRPSSHLLAVNGKKLSIYLHHGGTNAVYYDLVAGETEELEYIEVTVKSRFPSNAFYSSRTAVNRLLDSLMRVQWLPLTIRRLDLHYEDQATPLCHQLVLPFTEGIRLGPLGGIQQLPLFTAYEAVVREAITTISPYYRLLCAYRLYEGLNPLRKSLRELAIRLKIDKKLPKSPKVDLNDLRSYGFHEEFLKGIKNTQDFWQKTTDLRNSIAHFLTKNLQGPLEISDGGTYQTYSLCGAVLLSYSHMAFRDLWLYASRNLADLNRGSVLPTEDRRDAFILRPDENGPGKTN